MSIASNQATAGEWVERVAQVAVQTRADDLCRRGTAPEKVAYLAAVDLERGEALSKRAGRDGAGGDGDIGAATTGVEIGAETDQAGDITRLEVRRGWHVKDERGVGCGGFRGRDSTGAEGEDGGKDESEEMHFC